MKWVNDSYSTFDEAVALAKQVKAFQLDLKILIQRWWCPLWLAELAHGTWLEHITHFELKD